MDAIGCDEVVLPDDPVNAVGGSVCLAESIPVTVGAAVFMELVLCRHHDADACRTADADGGLLAVETHAHEHGAFGNCRPAADEHTRKST